MSDGLTPASAKARRRSATWAALTATARQVDPGQAVRARGAIAQVHEVGNHGGLVADALHHAQDVVVATEVLVHRDHERPGVLLCLGQARAEHANVGATEAVDGLLGVTHGGEEGAVVRQQLDHLHLLRARVLELVHHHQPEAPAVLRGDRGLVAQRIQREP